jgi:hypothetical protein
VINLFSRRVVEMSAPLVTRVVNGDLAARAVDNGVDCSMSRVGNIGDNATMAMTPNVRLTLNYYSFRHGGQHQRRALVVAHLPLA